eukprot:3996571-Amphidinium_carterae.2
MTDYYRADNVQYKATEVKQEILDWALSRAKDVANLLNGDIEAVTKQLQADKWEGAMATEKSVASGASLYLGLRITVLQPGNPVGLPTSSDSKTSTSRSENRSTFNPMCFMGRVGTFFGQLPRNIYKAGEPDREAAPQGNQQQTADFELSEYSGDHYKFNLQPREDNVPNARQVHRNQPV